MKKPCHSVGHNEYAFFANAHRIDACDEDDRIEDPALTLLKLGSKRLGPFGGLMCFAGKLADRALAFAM